MKFIVVLLALVLAVCAVHAAPVRREGRARVRVLVNRPTREDMFNARVRRDQPGVKGWSPSRPPLKPAPAPMMVRKGEYPCGNKVCKLQPGHVPKDCVGCQYPI